jgi:hypothetical protein
MPYAIFDARDQPVKGTYVTSIEPAGDMPQVLVWKPDPTRPGNLQGWVDSEERGAADFEIRLVAAVVRGAVQRSGFVPIQLKPTIAQSAPYVDLWLHSLAWIDPSQLSERWEVVCRSCGDTWRHDQGNLSEKVRALRGPYPSKSAAEGAKAAHIRQAHQRESMTAP